MQIVLLKVFFGKRFVQSVNDCRLVKKKMEIHFQSMNVKGCSGAGPGIFERGGCTLFR